MTNTYRRYSFTSLIKVTSHGSGGRAEIVFSHPSTTENRTDSALTNGTFTHYPLGTLLVVRIKMTNRRRMLGNIISSEVESLSSFLEKWETEISHQWAGYDAENGTDYKAEILDVAVSNEKPAVAPVAAPKKVASVSGDVYIEPKTNQLLETIRKVAENQHVSVLMIGGSGYGKTTVPEAKAKEWGMGFLRLNMPEVRDPEELLGFRAAKDGSTMNDDGETLFIESSFTKAVQAGNCVIVLDELNRVDPYISNILFSLLDHSGEVEVAGHKVKVGPNVIFVGTVNQGHQFTGTFTLDSALSNRFLAKVLVGPLPENIEIGLLEKRTGVASAIATKIVWIMGNLRSLNKNGQLTADASTRVSLQVSTLCANGLSIRDAFTFTILNQLNGDEARKVADVISQTEK